jgi:uncharacterized protein (UPF0371 family)
MAFTPAERFTNLGMSFPLSKAVGEAIEDIVPDNVVLLTTDQTVAGVKTFSSSPLVPTAALGTDTTAAASTEFVLANAGAEKAEIAALVALTNSTGEVGDDTVGLVPDATAAVTDTTAASLTSTNAAILAINEDLADLTDKVNLLIAALQA